MAAGKLTSEKLSELKEAFMLFDYMKTGRIYSTDVGAVIRSVGLQPSEVEIQAIQADINKKSDGKVDLQTLVQYVSQGVTSPPSTRPEELQDMFQLYDPNGTGHISQREMLHLLTSIGEKLTEEEARDLLRMTGFGDKDRVDYKKFTRAVIQG